MGFAIKTPKAPAVKAEPPVVADTQPADTAADHAQQSARRRGLLSTILTADTRKHNSLTAAPTAGEHTTLG